MKSGKALSRISLTLALLSWLALVFADLTLLFTRSNQIPSGFAEESPYILRSLYFVSLFFFFRYRIKRTEEVNFVDLLWRVFVTGLLTTIFSLSLKSFDLLIGNLSQNMYVVNLFYLINLGLAGAFIFSTFMVWKRLILYQKSRLLMRGWLFFEYALFASIIIVFLPEAIVSTLFSAILPILVVIGIILSANMKWVAFLNFKQKWKSILLMMLIMLYLGYFYINISGFEDNPNLLILHDNTAFLNGIFIFIFIYAFLSVLVILFNLPTSSVFEQKLGEVVNYQRLSQSIQTEQSEDKVYEILLDSAISTVFADAGWIEISANGQEEDALEKYQGQYTPYSADLLYYKFRIQDEEIAEIKKNLKKDKISNVFDFKATDRAVNYSKFQSNLKQGNFKTILALPIEVQNETIGALVLLKDVTDGFNREMAEIAHTFVNQAGISIENFRLLTSALENERYQEELKIAKKVQQSLLPKMLDSNEDFEIIAFSKAADEVGGDYYDSYRIDENKIALIIGDVSGKGTSAAFKFFDYANMALSNCLEKTSFIPASYFIIDGVNKRVDYARAGHCPTLYFSKKEGSARYFENRGLGLGILRNNKFIDHLDELMIDYRKDDVMVLYTDGITEAQNFKKEEFGYARLKNLLEKNAHKSPEEIQQEIIRELYEFSSKENVDDDYTLIIIKFK